MDELFPELHCTDLVLVRTQPATAFKMKSKITYKTLKKVKFPSGMPPAVFSQRMCFLKTNFIYDYTIDKETHVLLKSIYLTVKISERKE